MAYTPKQWQKAKVLFELGKSPQEIADEVGFKSRDTINKKSIKENWTKNRILQDKDDIVALEKENSTIQAKNSTMVDKISTLEDFEITILRDIVEQETKTKSLLFSTANLSLIRKNQLLTKNTKQIIEHEILYEDGKQISKTPKVFNIELNANDLKTIDEGIDKNAITLELAPRHASSQVQVNNNLGIIEVTQLPQKETITL